MNKQEKWKNSQVLDCLNKNINERMNWYGKAIFFIV